MSNEFGPPLLFAAHPDPMWIYDTETFTVLDVNDAAVQAYGHSRAEFLAKAAHEISPEALRKIDLGPGHPRETTRHRRQRGNGDPLDVDVTAEGFEFAGRPAMLVVERDVTGLVDELKQINDRFFEQDANLRAVQDLLNIGIWKLNMDSGKIAWSDDVYNLYGVNRGDFDNTFDGYVGLVFPDDRKDMVANYERFAASGEVDFKFEHRVEIAGRLVLLRAGAELTETAEGRVLTVVVQDITALTERDIAFTQANSLLGLAGRAAQLGGWRLQLDPERVTWSSQVAAIHGEPEGFSPTVAEGIGYYHPDHREQITTALNACVKNGVPFDEVLRLITAAGEDIWVRAIGEAEYNTDLKIIAVQGAFQNVSELVQARGEIDEISRRLAQTLGSITDGFFILDSDWRFTYLNSETVRLLEIQTSSLLNQVIWEALPFTLDGTIGEECRRAAQDGEAARFAAFYRPLDKWFFFSAYPTEHGLAVHFRDATIERAKSKQLLLLEAAVSRISDVLLITEADPIDGPGGPKIAFVNEAFVRLTGYSREEAIGQTPRMLQGPRTDRRELNRIREALKESRSVRAELVNYGKGGDSYDLELEIAPIQNADGIVSHFVAVQREITERKKKEQELRRAQATVAESERIQRSLATALAEETERLNFAQTVSGVGSWETDLDSYRVVWSPALYLIFGLRPDQFDGTHGSFLNLVHPDDRTEVDAAFLQSLESDKVDHKIDHRIVTSAGSSKIVSERWKVIRDANGKPERLIGTIHDISERVELEEMLRQSQKLESIGQLTGGVAHDFNNVLTIILANAELLSDQLGDERQLRVLADMTVAAAERGAELTKQLLSFARRQPLEPKTLDVGRLVAGMDGLLRRTTPEDIDIEVVNAGGLWMAEIDPGQLESAIINLAVNASQAMPNGGCLTVETGNAVLDDDYAASNIEVEPGQYVMISVSDSGVGMSAAVLEKAFEPFFTTKDVGKGTGLGLSMVYGFLKQSRGHAKIYSELGQGTTVKLYFPRSRSNIVPDVISEKDFRVVGGTEHILVVEDHDLLRQNLANQLTGLGYRVTQARSGADALERLGTLSDIDLLFTDVVMPGGINGKQLAVKAQALRPGLKVLFTSGYTENAIVHNGRLDADAHLLSKPYRRQVMAAKVRMVLDGVKTR